jgi:hypothetical protein
MWLLGGRVLHTTAQQPLVVKAIAMGRTSLFMRFLPFIDLIW